jgi:hypothetical protein
VKTINFHPCPKRPRHGRIMRMDQVAQTVEHSRILRIFPPTRPRACTHTHPRIHTAAPRHARAQRSRLPSGTPATLWSAMGEVEDAALMRGPTALLAPGECAGPTARPWA